LRERILIRGARVYDHDGDADFPRVADVSISGGRIDSVGDAPAGDWDRVIDGRGKLLLPGFFNTHYHAHDTLLKGCFEAISLDMWALLAMPHAYGRRSKEELRARVLVGGIECLRTGITTVQDMHSLNPFYDEDLDAVLSAYEELGLRVVLAPQFADVGRVKARVGYSEILSPEEQKLLSAPVRQFPEGADVASVLESLIKARRGRSELVSFALGPSSPESVSQGLWERLADLSAREKLPIYTHVYENKGMTHVAREGWRDHKGSHVHWLKALGALSPRMTLAHSVWMRQDEIELIADSGAHVGLNPVGNLKTRSGIAPTRQFLEAGVNVGLGCDNCSCSDVQNMFQAMKLYVALAAVCNPEEGRPSALDALRAATINGAKTAGRDDLGQLRAGMRADVTIIDLSDISYVPLNSAARQLVYTESGRGVESVIVDGRLVMQDRRILTVDEAEVREAIERVIPGVRKSLAEVRSRLAPIEGKLQLAAAKTWATDIGVHRFIGHNIMERGK
jgi:cytosine/adenosine deaminase-related metal-dependent hydrolase